MTTDIATVERADLATVVELLERSPQLVAVATEDARSRVASLVGRADLFGLPVATQIHTHTVADHDDKLACMAQLAAFVAQVPRGQRDAIEQCVDEMVMNALYDAPVDASGRHLFAAMPARQRVELRTDRDVVVSYAREGDRIWIAVRDSFGTLTRDIVVRHLHKGLHAKNKVDRKAGGAGLGLYLMATSANALYFTVSPGAACEVVCAFDLGAAPGTLTELAFCTQRTHRPPDRRPARVLPAARIVRRHRMRVGAAVGATVLLGACAIVAWPRVFGPKTASLAITTRPGAIVAIDGRTEGIARDGTLTVRGLAFGVDHTASARLDGHESRRIVVRPERGTNAIALELTPVPTIEIDSDPSGAWISVDDKPMGSTPLALTSLPPGGTATAVIEKSGYRTATLEIKAPARGQIERRMQTLVRDELVRVRIESTPPGAEVVVRGAEPPRDRIYTPAELFVAANREHTFELRMPHHAPAIIGPVSAPPGTDLVQRATLAN